MIRPPCAVLIAAGLLAACFAAGCPSDAQAEKGGSASFGPPRFTAVEGVDGTVLDEKSSPQEVAIAALKAMQQLLAAVQQQDAAKEQAARKVLYYLSAPQACVIRYQAGKARSLSAGAEHEMAIREVNTWWGRAVGFFVDEINFGSTTMNMDLGPGGKMTVTGLFYEGKNRATGRTSYLKVQVTQEGGYWRVTDMTLAPAPPGPPRAPATSSAPAPSAPATAPATSSAPASN